MKNSKTVDKYIGKSGDMRPEKNMKSKLIGNKNAHIGKLRKIKRDGIFTIVRKIQALLDELEENGAESFVIGSSGDMRKKEICFHRLCVSHDGCIYGTPNNHSSPEPRPEKKESVKIGDDPYLYAGGSGDVSTTGTSKKESWEESWNYKESEQCVRANVDHPRGDAINDLLKKKNND